MTRQQRQPPLLLGDLAHERVVRRQPYRQFTTEAERDVVPPTGDDATKREVGPLRELLPEQARHHRCGEIVSVHTRTSSSTRPSEIGTKGVAAVRRSWRVRRSRLSRWPAPS